MIQWVTILFGLLLYWFWSKSHDLRCFKKLGWYSSLDRSFKPWIMSAFHTNTIIDKWLSIGAVFWATVKIYRAVQETQYSNQPASLCKVWEPWEYWVSHMYMYFPTLKPCWCSLDRPKQGSLDGVITCQPWRPAFTTEGLLDYIIELIVSKDEVILTVNFISFMLILSGHW